MLCLQILVVSSLNLKMFGWLEDVEGNPSLYLQIQLILFNIEGSLRFLSFGQDIM